jgi:hypothetical protein
VDNEKSRHNIEDGGWLEKCGCKIYNTVVYPQGTVKVRVSKEDVFINISTHVSLSNKSI